MTSEATERFIPEGKQLLAERGKLLVEIAAQKTTISALQERLGFLERQAEALRREREHTAVLLLESEQQLAEVLATAEARLREHVAAALAEQEQAHAALAQQSAQLQHEVDQLQRQVAVFRTSKSWRLTRPLRALARRTGAKR